MAGVVLAFLCYVCFFCSVQFIIWLLGVAIFFDDYVNMFIVGNIMCLVMDKFRVFWEKLAYIVDSMVVLVVVVVFIIIWIGVELGYIDDGLLQIIEKMGMDLGLIFYGVFISFLKYFFYLVMILVFIFMLVYIKWDFGGMYVVEKWVWEMGELFIKCSVVVEEDMENLDFIDGVLLKWYNVVIFVVLVILIIFYGFIDIGLVSIYGELFDVGLVLVF